jgi:anaerobic magnesium-protoporphyrin IX monomethyl ester cyclase
MRILFVIQQLGFADHIAISYLSAIAKQLNHETYFCSLTSHNLYEMADTVKPDLVAYSANMIGFEELVEANRKVQDIHKCLTIMGGSQTTFSPETFKESGMDIYCVGEGEYPFRDLLERLEQGKVYDDIDNLITHKKINPVRDLISNLDELPSADRDLVLSHSYLKDIPKKTFYTSRGCMFNCSYCCNDYYQRLYRNKGKIFRRFSVERIIREMEDVQNKYTMQFVRMGDDLFAFRADEWLEEFAEKYSQRINKPFNCSLRFDRINDDVLALLKKANCYSITLSVDSTSQYVREHILHRSMKDVDIVKELGRIRDFGINTLVNYMLAAPESTLQDDLDTISLSRKAKVSYLAYTTTEPMKGTQLYQYCLEKGYIDKSFKGDFIQNLERSPLSCFSKKEKDIRYNIFLLGCLVSKLPGFLYNLGMWVIIHIKPNKVFEWIKNMVYLYHLENKIYRFSGKAKSIRREVSWKSA